MNTAKSKPSMPKASKPQASTQSAAKAKTSKPALANPKPSTPVASQVKPSTPAKSNTPRVPSKPARVKPKPRPPVAAKTTAAKLAAGSSTASKSEPRATKAALRVARAGTREAASLPVALSATKAKAGKAVKPAAEPLRLDTAAKIRPVEQAVGVSSDAVARRTGKSWAEWFALLDAAGGAQLDHKGIVAVLAQRHGVGPWWQQMVTVAYEQARGKRETQAAEEGFHVGVSKTLELPLAKLFRLWSEPAERNKWLADDRFSIHKATASKFIRARWGRGVSRIYVDFCEKGPTKSQVTVQHNRIETSDAADQMKAYWDKKIRALEALLAAPR